MRECTNRESASNAPTKLSLKNAQGMLAALFSASDQMEFRAIAGPLVRRHQPRVERMFCTLESWLSTEHRLHALNQQGYHIYFGVNPRAATRGHKSAIETCRSIWADLDNVTVEQAQSRCLAFGMWPSIVVNSGHGVHLYWLLSTPVTFTEVGGTSSFESVVKSWQQQLGGDATHDVTRFLRLPGTWNWKTHAPRPCQLVSINAQRKYAWADFVNAADPEAQSMNSVGELSLNRFTTFTDMARIRGLVQHLQQDAPDRSRRDYGVICQLLRLGLSVGEIWRLVQSHSKFATHGEAYFQRTIASAGAELDGARTPNG